MRLHASSSTLKSLKKFIDLSVKLVVFFGKIFVAILSGGEILSTNKLSDKSLSDVQREELLLSYFSRQRRRVFDNPRPGYGTELHLQR